jgi:hypothetical protein
MKRSAVITMDDFPLDKRRQELVVKALGKKGELVGWLAISGAGVAFYKKSARNPMANWSWERLFQKIESIQND